MGLPEEVGPKSEELLLALASMVVANVVSPPDEAEAGVIGAREVKDSTGKVIIKMGQNHHFIITDVKGGSVDSIDGNAGALMEIISNSYTISDVMKTGGFYTPIWENCR